MNSNSPWGITFTFRNPWGSNIFPGKKGITIVIYHLEWVTRLLVYRSPFLSIEIFSATPIRTTPAFFMWRNDSIVRVN